MRAEEVLMRDIMFVFFPFFKQKEKKTSPPNYGEQHEDKASTGSKSNN